MPLIEFNRPCTLIFGFLLTALGTGHALASEHLIACPIEIEASSLQITNVPAGWATHVPTSFKLTSAGPMDGPPSQMAVLKEDYYKKGKRQSVMKWNLPPDPLPDGKWLACNYGPTNNIILSRQIDDNTTACVVTHTHAAPFPDKIDVKCYW